MSNFKSMIISSAIFLASSNVYSSAINSYEELVQRFQEGELFRVSINYEHCKNTDNSPSHLLNNESGKVLLATYLPTMQTFSTENNGSSTFFTFIHSQRFLRNNPNNSSVLLNPVQTETILIINSNSEVFLTFEVGSGSDQQQGKKYQYTCNWPEGVKFFSEN